MRAAVLHNYGQPMKVEEVEIDDPKPTEQPSKQYQAPSGEKVQISQPELTDRQIILSTPLFFISS